MEFMVHALVLALLDMEELIVNRDLDAHQSTFIARTVELSLVSLVIADVFAHRTTSGPTANNSPYVQLAQITKCALTMVSQPGIMETAGVNVMVHTLEHIVRTYLHVNTGLTTKCA